MTLEILKVAIALLERRCFPALVDWGRGVPSRIEGRKPMRRAVHRGSRFRVLAASALALACALLSLGCMADFPAVSTGRNTAVDVDILEQFPAYSSVDLSSGGKHGTAIVQPDLTVRYTPDLDFVGPDEFLVRLTGQPGSRLVRVPLVVRPPYSLPGCAFSPYQDGQDPSEGDTVSFKKLYERLRIAAPHCEQVRFYALPDDLLFGPLMAKKLGLGVMAGAHLESVGTQAGRDFNEDQINRMIRVGNLDWANLLIVGNETQYHGVMDELTLIGYLETVAAAVPDVPVVTSEEYRTLLKNPAILEASDWILANVHPYWRGVPAEYAAETVYQIYQELVAKSNGKKVVISEVGWRSSGRTHECAEASPSNLRQVMLDLKTCAEAQDFEFLHFELADEPWKAPANDDGWGIFDQDWVMKPGMEDVFEGQSGSTDCSGGDLCPGASCEPSVSLTLPDCSAETDCDEWLRGRIDGVENTDDYMVFVYLEVAGRYWIKPWMNDPITQVWSDGTFMTDIFQVGTDRQATEVVAFLVEKDFDYQPPMSYSPSPPPDLMARVVASESRTREPCPPGG